MALQVNMRPATDFMPKPDKSTVTSLEFSKSTLDSEICRTVLRLGSRGTEHRQRALLAVLSHACTHLLVLTLYLYRQVVAS